MSATSRKHRILVVDDEPQITRVLRMGLNGKGFEVRTASDADAALDTFRDWSPDLVITDLSMPGLSGIELCRGIRSASSVPIIVLSVKGDEAIKVEALDAGADDYIVKPFGMDELVARIRAVLRRAPAATAHEPETHLEIGDFHADLEARLISVGSQPVRLTPKEFDLLVFMIRNAGKVLTHQMLLSAVWGSRHAEQLEYLRVFVGQLRKKIEPDPSHPRYILTEPWIGYRFDPGEVAAIR